MRAWSWLRNASAAIRVAPILNLEKFVVPAFKKWPISLRPNFIPYKDRSYRRKLFYYHRQYLLQRVGRRATVAEPIQPSHLVNMVKLADTPREIAISATLWRKCKEQKCAITPDMEDHLIGRCISLNVPSVAIHLLKTSSVTTQRKTQIYKLFHVTRTYHDASQFASLYSSLFHTGPVTGEVPIVLRLCILALKEGKGTVQLDPTSNLSLRLQQLDALLQERHPPNTLLPRSVITKAHLDFQRLYKALPVAYRTPQMVPFNHIELWKALFQSKESTN